MSNIMYNTAMWEYLWDARCLMLPVKVADIILNSQWQRTSIFI